MIRSAPNSRATLTGPGLASPPSTSHAPRSWWAGKRPAHRTTRAPPCRGVTARKGDEPAGPELGGDRDERNVELLDQASMQRLVYVCLKPVALDGAAVRKYEIHRLLPLHGRRGGDQLLVAYAASVERADKAARARAATKSARMPALSSTLSTPTWAKPRAPPPPSTNAITSRSALWIKTSGAARGGGFESVIAGLFVSFFPQRPLQPDRYSLNCFNYAL